MKNDKTIRPEGITVSTYSVSLVFDLSDPYLVKASSSSSTPNMTGSVQTATAAPEDPFAVSLHQAFSSTSLTLVKAVLALARVTLTSAPASTSPPGPGDDARVDGAALPDEWRQDPEHPERCIETWRRSTSQKYGHLLGDITSRDESGRLVARSRGFPSPAPSDDKHRNTTFIWVEKAGFDPKRIDLADLPKYEADN